MIVRKPYRTLRRAIDLRDMTAISSDALLACDADRYQDIRRAATRARNEKSAVFVCEKCGYPVYAPREPATRLPFWRHHKGAPQNCPWWTGEPSSTDAVSGSQFQGAQESPLHVRLKNVVADLLRSDPLTETGSVVVDQYIGSHEGRRRPDVRAIYDGRPIALEIQLATTQIPIIIAREDFYAREGRHLVWLTWNFEPVERARMPTAFEDIFYSHNKNLFSLDDEVIAEGRSKNGVRLRAFWEGSTGWESKVVELANLIWPESGLPFAVAPRPAWHMDFRERWLAATTDKGTPWPARRDLLAELAGRLNIEGVDGAALDAADFESLLNCILSFVTKHPVGSRQHNLIEVINTFLSSDRRHGFARLMRKVATVTAGTQFLAIKSVQDKFAAAGREAQDGPDTITGRVALLLFPELFKQTH